MSRIALLRHGSTPANEQWLYCGATDISLSERGRTILAAKRALGGYPTPEGRSVATSGMKRAEETLDILYGNVTHTACEGLREINFGIFEMRDYFALEKQAEFQTWLQGGEEAVPPGGESAAQFRQRVLAAFDAVVKSGADWLIVCHGGVIAAVMDAYFPDAGKNRYDWQPTGGEGYEIVFDGESAVSWRGIPDVDANILAKAEERGFSAAYIAVEDIPVNGDFLRYCEENRCGNYNANYACPPACGTPAELHEKLLGGKRALVLQSCFAIPGYDSPEIPQLKKRHTAAIRDFMLSLRDAGYKVFGVGYGGCDLCERCSLLDGEPCRLPELRMSCLSAYCVDAAELAKRCELPFAWDPKKLHLFGMIVFE